MRLILNQRKPNTLACVGKFVEIDSRFYKVCEEVLEKIKNDDNRVLYVDKEKVFNDIYAERIPPHKWENAISEMAKRGENNWAYNECNKDRLKK